VISVVNGLMSSCDTLLTRSVLESGNSITILGLVPMVSRIQLITKRNLCDHIRKEA